MHVQESGEDSLRYKWSSGEVEEDEDEEGRRESRARLQRDTSVSVTKAAMFLVH